MRQPKRTKFRKLFKGRIHGDAKGGSDLNFGTYGLKATEPERVTARPIEAARPRGPRPRGGEGGPDRTLGPYGLKAPEPGRVTARQIEAARRALTRHMKRQGRAWIRVLPDAPAPAKP